MITVDERKDRDLFERARAWVEQYRLTLQPDGRGGFVGSSTELPRVIAEGATAAECVQAVQDALCGAVALMLKAGKAPPVPVRERRRDEQINLRVSTDEKLLLEASARQQGFRSVSDFVRSKALAGATQVA